MKLVYTNEELEQRSDEWLKIRSTCIGGSDVATVLSLNKYEKPITLWKRKVGRLKPKKSNAAMEYGTMLESEALEKVVQYLSNCTDSVNISQFFAKHPEYDFIGISYDGVDLENKFLVELKCPMYMQNFALAVEQGIPDRYYPQVQLQLFVANSVWGIRDAFFCSYYPDGMYTVDLKEFKEKILTLSVHRVEYDEEFCSHMLPVIQKFWNMVELNYWDNDGYLEKIDEFNRLTNSRSVS